MKLINLVRRLTGLEPLVDLDSLSESDREAYEERIAIMIADGGLSAKEAEREAATIYGVNMSKELTHGDEKQIEANRKNALKSTGPKSDEGKEVVRYNAVKHGVYAKDLVLKGGMIAESADEFSELAEALMNDLKPEGALEMILCEKIAAAIWRLKRVQVAEQGSFADRIDRATRMAGIGGRPELHFWFYSEPVSNETLFNRGKELAHLSELTDEEMTEHEWFEGILDMFDYGESYADLSEEDREFALNTFKCWITEDAKSLVRIVKYQERLQREQKEALVPNQRLTKEEERLERSLYRDIAQLKKLQEARADK